MFINYLIKRKRNLLSLFFIFLFLSLNDSAFAQSNGTLKGVVKDAKTEETLPGANVILVGTHIGQTTKINGEFSLHVPAGKYQLQLSYVGYKTIKKEITIQSSEILSQDIFLQSDIVGANEVVVLGTRTSDRTVINSPVPVDIISAKEIEQSGFTQTSELLKTLIPSYNAPQASVTDGSDHVRPASLRGLGPDQVLVLVNGKRRYTSALVNVNGTIGRGSRS